jgi:Flp pilus assembly protein TadD
LREVGQLEAAVAPLRHAAQFNPSAADLQVNLANVLLDLRRFGPAADCYQRAIELDA